MFANANGTFSSVDFKVLRSLLSISAIVMMGNVFRDRQFSSHIWRGNIPVGFEPREFLRRNIPKR
jgi:hypothetical protein